jgi:hypothetical protein
MGVNKVRDSILALENLNLGMRWADEDWRIDISGLLLNICIALPDALTSSIASALTVTATPTSTSSASAKPTKNAAANAAFQPWQLLVVPFAVFGGLVVL